MDYEKKYKEALEDMRVIYPNLKGDAKLAVEHAFPELRESEDERIRKELINFLRSPFIKENLTDEKVAPWLAYLEKQKDAFENGRQLGIMQEQARQELEWTGEKQKEQSGEDEECTDFTIYHPLKNGKGEYKCIPYSFYGSLTSFSEDKDLIDFFRTCFYTEKECNEWIEQQKEQKPGEKQDYSGLTDLERAIHRGFLIAGVENVPVTIIKETAKECLEQMKPAEWSESDTLMCNAALDLLRSHPNLMASHGVNKSSIIRWLQSFRPQKRGFIDDICSKAGISIPYLDGNQWCILKGDNIQSGVVGFGGTKEDALADFIKDVPIPQQ